MQPGARVVQQRFAETAWLFADSEEVVQGRFVVLQLFQTQANPSRQLGLQPEQEAHNVPQ